MFPSEKLSPPLRNSFAAAVTNNGVPCVSSRVKNVPRDMLALAAVCAR